MSDDRSQVDYWVSTDAVLPNACLVCGMYTDQRVTTKFAATTQTQVAVESAPGGAGWGCFLMLLGPLGLLISLLSSLQKKQTVMKTKNVTVTTKLKIPLCPFCKSERSVGPHDADIPSGLLAFEAHEDFIRQYEQLNGESD